MLYRYNFAKTCHDPNYREFRNPNFIKGRRDLLSLIKRKAQSGISSIGGSSGVASTNRTNTSRRRNAPIEGMEIEEDALDGANTGNRSSNRKRTSTYKAMQTHGASNQRDDRMFPLQAHDTYTYAGHGDDSHQMFDSMDNGNNFTNGGYNTFSNVGEDYSTIAAIQNDLRWRVRQLETTNTQLMERYTELVSKHDELCSLVHAYLKGQRASSAPTLSSYVTSSSDKNCKQSKTKDMGSNSAEITQSVKRNSTLSWTVGSIGEIFSLAVVV